mgnify:CR=1 FL=1
MILSFDKQFKQKVLNGEKKQTIRKDKPMLLDKSPIL